MELKEVAHKLVDLCRKGEFHTAMAELYSKDIVSVEPVAMNGMSAESKGIDATMAKGKWWVDNHEVHGMNISGPFTHGDKFIVVFDFDITQKATGKRFNMVETGLYWVAGGKVVREEFFYLSNEGK